MVDTDDFDRLCERKWYLSNRGYACCAEPRPGGGSTQRQLHSVLLPDAPEVDHINRDKLDNRRSNLRAVTHQQNMENMAAHRDSKYSKHRGVTFNQRKQKWVARACINYRNHWLGYFTTEEAAADAAARFREHHMSHATD